jgi:hypothetical protein
MVGRGDGVKMEKEIGRTEKTTVIEKFLENCGTSIYHLKEKVAVMSIDMTGTLKQEYVLLLRILRGHGPSLEYHKDGTDGYDDHQRFWFEFPLHFYRDIMSGWDIEEDEGGYRLTDEDGELTAMIDKNEIKVWLKNDLLVYNYGGFNHPNWENFLDDLYNWIIEPDEGAIHLEVD